jgi:FlaA1/EpsC-like NDP-sugar epimerase
MGRIMRPVAFIDDDSGIADRIISGLQVYKPKHIQQMIEETGAQEVLLAIPSATRGRRREILGFLEGFPLHVRSVPGFMDLASGRVKVDDIQEVDIADLLGRDSVPAQDDLLEHCIRNQAVMVTGAGGSIGSELCRQILSLHPTTLLLYEHSEFNLYNILSELEQRVARESLSVRLLPILGSIRNRHKLLDVMRAWNVGTVYHAAAYKHVPMVEHNIAEGVLNNVFGTLNTAQAALKAGVANFVLISTDKAVRPTNVMGSTKRFAEMTLQALSRELAPVLFGDDTNISHVNKTRFTMVRFGNVLGSSGSVIPLFHKQIKSGGPLTVTHPKITRYFMTIPEAAQLVIQAGSMGQGGDVFVLDMGEPVKIVELAEKMIHLSGLSVRSEKNTTGDISIVFTGLRPGEKLYEELLIGDNVAATQHPMIMSADEDHLAWDILKVKLGELLRAVEQDDYVRVRQLLRDTVSGYTPDGEIVDWIYRQRRLEP